MGEKVLSCGCLSLVMKKEDVSVLASVVIAFSTFVGVGSAVAYVPAYFGLGME